MNEVAISNPANYQATVWYIRTNSRCKHSEICYYIHTDHVKRFLLKPARVKSIKEALTISCSCGYRLATFGQNRLCCVQQYCKTINYFVRLLPYDDILIPGLWLCCDLVSSSCNCAWIDLNVSKTLPSPWLL